jgi:tetratricopeptide (TPR) repeat protein
MLQDSLRLARVRLRRGESRITVLSEEQFLAGLGMDVHRESAAQLCRIDVLAHRLDVPADRVRAWVRAGLLRPRRVEHGVWWFDLRQASAARTLCDLTRAGVTVPRLRKSLEQLRAWVPEAGEPLQQLGAIEDYGRLLVRMEAGDLSAADGQLHFEFAPAEEVTADESPLSGEPLLRIAGGGVAPRTAADWYAQAVDQDAAGYLAEAAESYREALLVGGPDAQTCFDLGHCLQSQGKLERAAERYAQATEVEPRFGEAWNNLAVVLAELGRCDDAVSALRRALSLDPRDPRAHYNLADLLDECGRSAEAAPHWRAYLRLDQTSQWAAHARGRLNAG